MSAAGLIERHGEAARIHSVGPLQGVAHVPGSKSLANRHLVCSALGDALSVLRGAPDSDDVQAMIACLRQLGIGIERRGPDVLEVHGCGGAWRPCDELSLNVADAGTVMRFLTAVCALSCGDVVLDGSDRMRDRPLAGLVDALREMGARIEYLGNDGYPPLRVHGGGLAGGSVDVRSGVSSQFISALLMCAPYARRDVSISASGGAVSVPYIDMTISVMRLHGVEVLANQSGGPWIIPSFQRYAGGEFAIEPDASAAAYLWAAAAITGGRVCVADLSAASAQGDVGFAQVLAAMGCDSSYDEDGITVRRDPQVGLRGIDVDLCHLPDAVQALAAVAMFARGQTVIRNVAHLRFKEADRLAGLAEGLARLGAKVAVSDSDITIDPPDRIRPGRLDTCNDHRMAMSFAIIGLAAPGIELSNVACVRKSFPRFFDVLAELANA